MNHDIGICTLNDFGVKAATKALQPIRAILLSDQQTVIASKTPASLLYEVASSLR
jgi:hypothetical protein